MYRTYSVCRFHFFFLSFIDWELQGVKAFFRRPCFDSEFLQMHLIVILFMFFSLS